MKTTDCRELRQLLNEGREILNDPFVGWSSRGIKQKFIRWRMPVADCLIGFFPDRGYSGQWVALEGSNLQLHLVNKDVDESWSGAARLGLVKHIS